MPSKPHTKEEQIFWNKGHDRVAGVDEAGRGAWAGPIVAAAVILPPNFSGAGINDSKKLTPKQREKLFVKITRGAIAWSVAVVNHDVIDSKGMTHANTLVLTNAVKKLQPSAQAVLVDAMKITVGKKPVKAVIDGDAKVLAIAAASIVAKVARDALMDGHHRLLPQYGFSKHKGYGTPQHIALIKKYGLSSIHRTSFKPLRPVAKKVATKTKKR